MKNIITALTMLIGSFSNAMESDKTWLIESDDYRQKSFDISEINITSNDKYDLDRPVKAIEIQHKQHFSIRIMFSSKYYLFAERSWNFLDSYHAKLQKVGEFSFQLFFDSREEITEFLKTFENTHLLRQPFVFEKLRLFINRDFSKKERTSAIQ